MTLVFPRRVGARTWALLGPPLRLTAPPPPPLLSVTVGEEDLSDPTEQENKETTNKPLRGQHIISRAVASL